MAIFSVEIADADVTRVLDAVAANFGRPESVENPDYTGPVEVVDGDGNPVLDEDGMPTYEEPVDADGNPITATIDNPETKAVFANRKVREFLQEHVISHETRVARKAAAEALDTSININDPQS